MKNLIKILTVAIGVLFGGLLSEFASAQKDNVYLVPGTGARKSVLRGKVVASSVFKVTIDIDGNRQDIPASDIKKITFSGEPRNLGRARDQFGSQRYDDCLDTLKKIEESIDSKYVKQEVQFLTVYSAGKKALRGDKSVTTETAEQQLGSFVKSNNDSYRLVIAVDLYGQLLMANGKTGLAQKEFNKLTKSKWREYETRGHFFEGETLIHQGKLIEASNSYQALAKLGDNDDESRRFRLLAECQLAKLAALQGDVDKAIPTIEEIIQNENSDDTKLFAYAYNALGTCYLKSNELKQACRAFLHTELLFSTEADAHAEALYNLAKIWPQLKQTGRANRARELLGSRYRNTIWAAKL